MPLVLCTLATSVFAADEAAPRDAPHFSLAPNALYTAASSPTPPEGTDVAILTEEGAYVFDAQGRTVRTFYLVYKVLTQRGAEGWDNVSTSWGPWHEERPSLRARVITPDFAVHELDLKTVSDAPVKEDESSLYSDGRETRAPLPAIAPGSVVEEEIVVKENAPLFDAGTASSFYFGRVQVPVQHSRLVLDAPSSLTLRYDLRLLADMKPQRTEADNRVKLVFDSGPLPAEDQSEANLPRDEPAFPEVMFSTGASWQKIAEDYSVIVDSHMGGADLRNLAEKLTKGKHSSNDKARAIAEYLNKEVRYTGIEFGEAAIVPHSASETLVRKYGDCKDKATLLVAMLRAAGVPAYVALLHAGGRMDIPTDLPGMGMFDHAIAYVPASTGGDSDIWIDATDEYSRFGQLPAADQGRPALIARKGTTALVRIPESKSADNVLRETREFYLSENGKARIVETSTPSGCFESQYRSIYADKENKGNRENLTSYMKSQYLAETLDRMDRLEPQDFSKPFELVLESKKAGRGDTELSTAVAAIRLDGLFYQLPNELKTREDPEEEKEKQKANAGKPKKPRTADYQLRQPFIAEWNYKIVPPSGFQAKPLPKDANVAIGPALLTEQFSADAQGVVHGLIRFDSVKARFTVAEAAQMRDKIADLVGAEAILINFEPVGEALLKQGKVQEALASYRGLIAQHPNQAVHHLRLANVLLEAGIGEAARREAFLAAKLEPNSALAQKVLGDTLEYDLLGRRFRTGTDYAGAAAAYRAAMKLDPDDKNTVVALGYLLEQNDEGVRYGAGAKLKEAAAEYQKLTPAELVRLGFQNNLAYALFYAGEFAEARKSAETLNPSPGALMVAIEAATAGSQAAIAEANKRSQGDAQLKEMLSTAGNMLMNSRKYQLAADLIQAGASGDDTARVMGLASVLSQAKLHEQYQITNDPAGIVNEMLLSIFEANPTIENLKSLQSRNALRSEKSDKEELDSASASSRQLRRSLIHSGLAPDIGIDLIMHAMAPQVDGNDALGYRERLQMGPKKMTIFIVKEEGQYKILDTSEKPNAVGLEVLDRVAARDLDGARVLLDWERDERHLEGGDDPLAGDPFPRLWTKGEKGDAARISTAAAAMLVAAEATSQQGVSILEEVRKSATGAAKTNIDLALMPGLNNIGNYAEMLAISTELAEANPESRTAFLDQSLALRGLGRIDEANALAEQRLKRLPDDLDAPRAMESNAMAKGDYRAAYTIGRKLADAGKAEGDDLNGMAWQTLFFERPEGADVESAVKASRLSQNNASILHTLGCVYAETNKTKEAREVLTQAMDVVSMDEPNEAFWYAFGRIAEQYGELEVARADYEKVSKPKKAIQIPDSTYLLAQNRLNAMKTSQNKAATK